MPVGQSRPARAQPRPQPSNAPDDVAVRPHGARLGEILARHRCIATHQVTERLLMQRASTVRIGETLLTSGAG